MRLLIFLIVCFSAAAKASNTTVESFSHAKKMLMAIYADHPATIYSNCQFDEHKHVQYEHCDYVPIRDNDRANRIEWEHVVPASLFGQNFYEWKVGHPMCVDRRGKRFKGRHCAAKMNVDYRHVEADMYNLYPEIGELNERRGNLPITQVRVGVMVDALDIRLAADGFQPAARIRGDLARTYLYMDEAYPELAILSRDERRVFAAWSEHDPVDAWECERARRIADAQGNRNMIVDKLCQLARL